MEKQYAGTLDYYEVLRDLVAKLNTYKDGGFTDYGNDLAEEFNSRLESLEMDTIDFIASPSEVGSTAHSLYLDIKGGLLDAPSWYDLDISIDNLLWVAENVPLGDTCTEGDPKKAYDYVVRYISHGLDEVYL